MLFTCSGCVHNMCFLFSKCASHVQSMFFSCLVTTVCIHNMFKTCSCLFRTCFDLTCCVQSGVWVGRLRHRGIPVSSLCTDPHVARVELYIFKHCPLPSFALRQRKLRRVMGGQPSPRTIIAATPCARKSLHLNTAARGHGGPGWA
jgi:hypothetical protein